MSPSVRSERIEEAELEQFVEQGYLRLGRVVTDEEIEELRRRIDEIMLGQVRYDGMMMQLDPSFSDATDQTKGFKGATLNYRKIQDLELDPVFRRYLSQPLFRSATKQLIGEDVAIFRAMFMNKPANGGVVLPWHQDGASYADPSSPWAVSIAPQLTIWTALDPATVANGCVQVVPGSHRSILGESGDFLTEAEVARHVGDRERVYLELEAGEAALLHNWTLHMSEPNTTDRPRRAFSVCYIDAATRQTGTGATFPVIFPEYKPAADGALVTVEY